MQLPYLGGPAGFVAPTFPRNHHTSHTSQLKIASTSAPTWLSHLMTAHIKEMKRTGSATTLHTYPVAA